MRTFILGGLMAGVIWAFLPIDGGGKLRQAWDSFQETRLIARAQELATERESAFVAHFQPPRQCLAPTGELKKLECQNHRAMAQESFYAEWNRVNAKRFPK